MHERHDLARGERANIYLPRTEIIERHDGQVHDEHEQRHDRAHQTTDLDVGIRQVAIDLAEALALKIFLVVCANRPDALQLFAHNAVHRIDAALERTQERHADLQEERHDDDNDRDHHEDEQRHFGVREKRHDHRTDEHDRGHDRHGNEHLQESFDLLSIVGVTRDERGGAEGLEFR